MEVCILDSLTYNAVPWSVCSTIPYGILATASMIEKHDETAQHLLKAVTMLHGTVLHGFHMCSTIEADVECLQLSVTVTRRRCSSFLISSSRRWGRRLG